jgi:hypothetical protein
MAGLLPVLLLMACHGAGQPEVTLHLSYVTGNGKLTLGLSFF